MVIEYNNKGWVEVKSRGAESCKGLKIVGLRKEVTEERVSVSISPIDKRIDEYICWICFYLVAKKC